MNLVSSILPSPVSHFACPLLLRFSLFPLLRFLTVFRCSTGLRMLYTLLKCPASSITAPSLSFPLPLSLFPAIALNAGTHDVRLCVHSCQCCRAPVAEAPVLPLFLSLFFSRSGCKDAEHAGVSCRFGPAEPSLSSLSPGNTSPPRRPDKKSEGRWVAEDVRLLLFFPESTRMKFIPLVFSPNSAESLQSPFPSGFRFFLSPLSCLFSFFSCLTVLGVLVASIPKRLTRVSCFFLEERVSSSFFC